MSCGNSLFSSWVSGVFCGLGRPYHPSHENNISSNLPTSRPLRHSPNKPIDNIHSTNNREIHQKVINKPPDSVSHILFESYTERNPAPSIGCSDDSPNLPTHHLSCHRASPSFSRQVDKITLPPMLSKIGNALQAAADVVAPPCARVEDLRYHWSQVVVACQRCQGPNPFSEGLEKDASKDGNATSANVRASLVPAVEETHAPRHLAQMLKILISEEGGGFGSLSPCLEFLVTERVLTSLASFAWCDRPLGVRQHAYVFLAGVLSHLHHSHLHHARIHKPLQSMVKASSDMTASPYEVQEIDFLTTLCEKIRHDHSLVLLYIKPGILSEGTSTDLLSYSQSTTPVPEFPPSPSCINGTAIAPNCDSATDALNAHRKNSLPCSTGEATPQYSKLSLPNTPLPPDKEGLHQRTPSISSIHSSDSSTRCSSMSLNSYASSTQLCRPRGIQSSFPLVDALLNLCGSADVSISSTAHDTLLLLCGVREPACSRAIARHTLFPHYVATKIAESIAKVPKDVDPVLIEDLVVPKEKPRNYTETAAAAVLSADVPSSSDSEDNESTATDEGVEDFQGRRELLQMLAWLAFCDKVVSTGDSVLGSSVCLCVKEIVLDGELREALVSDGEEVVSFTVALLTRMLSALSSHSLVMCVVAWLCSGSSNPYDDNLLSVLLNYCRNSPHQVAVLRLLQVAIESSAGGATSLLISPWLTGRQYYDSSAAEVQQTSWSDEEDERAKLGAAKEALSPGTHPISRTFAPNNVNRIVKQFLCVVPEELQSSGSDDFESYKSDAVRQYRSKMRVAGSLQWGKEAVFSSSHSSAGSSRESPPEGEESKFSAGPFLCMLLELLGRLPQQDYDVNLQVTSVLSSLALLPHPYLHELLLNPSLPMVPSVQTPYRVLRAVTARLRDAILSTPDYKQHLKLSRHQLLGDLNSWQLERDDTDRQFEAVIVIEEFCKELASIVHAKYTVEVEGM